METRLFSLGSRDRHDAWLARYTRQHANWIFIAASWGRSGSGWWMITLHYVEFIECSLRSFMILCECPRQEKCYDFLGNPPRPSLSRALEPSLLLILLLTLSSISGDQMVATSMEFDYHSGYHSNTEIHWHSVRLEFLAMDEYTIKRIGLREIPMREDTAILSCKVRTQKWERYIYKPPDQPDDSRAFLLCLMKSSPTDKLIICPFFIAEGQRGTVYQL